MTFQVGSGVGGSPQPPQIRESETTAFTEVNKALLALVPADTYEVRPFFERSDHELFKYKAESGHPTLHPLLFLRAGAAEDLPDGSWKAAYDELLDFLPPDVKARLTWELQQPAANRDADYTALNEVLTMVAKGLGWLETVSRPTDPSSPAAALRVMNSALPYVAAEAGIRQAAVVFNAVNISTNDPHYEVVTRCLTEGKSTVEDFSALLNEIKKGGDSPELRVKITLAADRLASLSEDFTAKGLDTTHGQLGATLSALSTAALALSYGSGTPSLLISSSIALIGIETSASEAGLIGKALGQLLENTLDGVLNAIPSGVGAEIEELETLYGDLIVFRDNREGG